MSYEIRFRRLAQKQLDAIRGRDYERIAQIVTNLADNPRPQGVKKLAGSGLWRVRAGVCRVVYSIEDDAKIVIVVRVARRSEDTYKGL